MTTLYKSIYHFLRGIHRKIPVKYSRFYYDPAWKVIAFYKACVKNVRPIVTILEGTDPSGRFPLAIAYAGEKTHDFEYWASLTLAPDFKKRVLGRKWVWQIKKAVRRLCHSCSMIIFETSALILRTLLKYNGLQSASWVGMTIDISEPVELTWRKRICKQRAEAIRRIRKNNLSYFTSNDPKLFDEFYYHMHIPFIKARHQKEAFITGYDETKRFFLNGILIFIKQGEDIIAGQVIALNEKVPVLKVLGVKDGKDDYLRLGVVGAMYYFPVLEMRKRGYTALDIGRTRPFFKNGVTAYKINLGAKLMPEASSARGHTYITFVKNTEGLRNFLIQNPFLYFKRGRLCRAFFVKDGQFRIREDFDQYLKLHACDGAEGTSVFVFGNRDTVNDWVNSGNDKDMSVESAEALFSGSEY